MDLTKINFKKLGIGLLIGVTCLSCYGYASSFIGWKWEIWKQRQHGMAELARAEGNRQIRLAEARAEMESAKCHAEAEVIRAKGVAEANKIIGDSLKGNDAYLKYRFIEGLQTNQMQTIYIPHDGMLPITESTRFLEYRNNQAGNK